MVRAFVRELLEARGYDILEAAHKNGLSSSRAPHRGPIDLLMTDVVMPRMSGRALAEQLEFERPGVPVLYTSGYASGRIGARAPSAPGANFIQKPFSAEELAAKVREILDASAPRPPPRFCGPRRRRRRPRARSRCARGEPAR